ncbi:MAG: hypothetical protein WBD55_11505 [Dehalococcoidia bacterium]
MDRDRPQTITERLGFMAYLFVVGGTTNLEALVDEALAEPDVEFVYEPATPSVRPLDASQPFEVEAEKQRVEITPS